MSWIKPNFLWMMFRSGWGQKEGQEITLGLGIRREFFGGILAQAFRSTYKVEHYPTQEAWHAAVASWPVRPQWDPDHGPHGEALERRAIQIGQRGAVLEALGQRELLEVIDMAAFVAEQSERVRVRGSVELVTPTERPYVPADPAARKRLGL